MISSRREQGGSKQHCQRPEPLIRNHGPLLSKCKASLSTFAAREILRHVRAGGRFRDVAVLARQLEPYQDVFRRVFTRYEIPFFLDRREPIAHHPLAELTRYEPAMVTAVEKAVVGASDDLGFVRLAPDAFVTAPQKSIDYAVMEKTDRAAVVAGNFRWSDIGSWDAIFDIAERDKAGNAVHGTVVTSDSRNCKCSKI